MSRTDRHFRFMAWLLIWTLFLPAPMMNAGAVQAAPDRAYVSDNPLNAHIIRRLNSPERARAVAEAARLEAERRAGEAYAREEGGEMSPLVQAAPAPLALPPGDPRSGMGDEAALAVQDHPAGGQGASGPLRGDSKEGQRPSLAAKGTSAASRPRSVTEVLFTYGAGFMGLPGLAPGRGADGSLDEGLGFHQDGTARRAGGVAGASGPSDRGQRARTYMQSGFQNGYGAGFGQPGYAPGLYDDLHHGLWRDDHARGGRRDSYSREYSDFDPMNMAIDRGLSWGAGLVNSMGEAALSGLVDGGRARLNFRLDRHGYFNGEGDALLPLYDGTFTTVYTQIGARSMHDSDDTRWIGNVGLGQRWFPLAAGEDVKAADYDTGPVMLGYNAFFDYDFSRSHQRGGVGIEAQFDWLRLSSNYYFPLSSWRGSRDFDSRFVQERPAEGWDLRAKGYVPFYRNLALTGAYSQWYGDHVGMFGASRLEKDPKVWSYGIEYTPVPLVSGFITQKSTERGRSDTEFGLTFTYHFQMPWEDQISHGKVAELRTVGGSRHEFVDRENRIVLEYRAKNSYRIEFLGQDGSNTFRFRIRDGFDEFRAGQTVRVTADGVTLAAAPAKTGPEKSLLAATGSAIAGFFSVGAAHAADFSQTYTTDRRGEFVVRVSSPASGPLVLYVQAGDNTQSFTVNVVADSLTISTGSPLPDATLNAFYSQPLTVSGGTAPYTLTVTNGALPAGLTLSGHSISGTPTGAGTFTFTVTATDSASPPATASKQFTLTAVHAAGYTLEASPDALTQNMAENVTFTVKKNGAAAGSGVPVTFDANANFPGLPAGTQSTDANGQIIVTGLTATATGSQTITATVDGQMVNVVINVTSGTFTLEASPDSLTRGSAASVTFTLKEGGAPVGAGLSVSFEAHPAFLELSGQVTRSTDSAGRITLSLTAVTPGSQTLRVTVNGQMVNVVINVTSGTFTLEASPDSLTQGSAAFVTFTLKEDGAPVGADLSVSFEAHPAFLELSGQVTRSTDSAGRITLSLTAVTPGSQTVSATVFGQTMSVAVTVNPGAYTLEATPDTLDLHTFTDVTFTFRQGGQTVPANTPVIFGANTSFTQLSGPVTRSTDAWGRITMGLTAFTPGNQTIQATVNGQPVNVTISVFAGAYNLQASPATLTQGISTPVTFTVKQGGLTVAANTPVAFDGNANFTELASPVTRTTGPNGQITLHLTPITAGSHTISAIVGSQSVNVAINVTSGVYSLEAAPDSLPVSTPTAVTFTVKQDGYPVGPDTSVTFHTDLSVLELSAPVTRPTDGAGRITMQLTITVAGGHYLWATVNGQIVKVYIST